MVDKDQIDYELTKIVLVILIVILVLTMKLILMVIVKLIFRLLIVQIQILAVIAPHTTLSPLLKVGGTASACGAGGIHGIDMNYHNNHRS